MQVTGFNFGWLTQCCLLAGAPLNTVLILLIGETREAPFLIGEGLPRNRKSHASNDQYLRSHPAKDGNICLVFGLMVVPGPPIPPPAPAKHNLFPFEKWARYVCMYAICPFFLKVGGRRKI